MSDMGLPLKGLVSPEMIQLPDLSGKIIAIDAYNILYQFLASIRGADGSPLVDYRGRVTSHLKGLLNRTSAIVASGIRPVFVFDGLPDKLKSETIAARNVIRDNAATAWRDAIESGDMERARQMGQQSVRLSQEDVRSAKELLFCMGIPCVNAPGEGEAQAAYMASRGDVWAAASQDYDTLLFGAPRLIRNLTLSGRRKIPYSDNYKDVGIELLSTGSIFQAIGLNRSELTDACLMMGTDFNSGYRGIGPKTAVKLLKRYKTFEAAALSKSLQVPDNLQYLRNIFLVPNVTNDYRIEFVPPNMDKTIDMLVNDYGFHESSVWTALSKMAGRNVSREAIPDSRTQISLSAFEL